jgi:hypothetical protein
MTPLHRPPASAEVAGGHRHDGPARWRRPTGLWTAGFGPTDDPLLANVTAVSHRAARRRLARCLALHRDVLAAGPAARQAFAEAFDALAATGPGRPFRRDVAAGGHPITFWLLPAGDADRQGSRPKR